MLKKEITSSLKIKGGLSSQELQGKTTKKETELLRMLTNWHNNSKKRNFFIGEQKANT